MAQDDALECEEKVMGDPAPIEITLTATLSGNVITVAGPGNASLPVNQKATRFNFTLNDNTGYNVKFASLDAADNSTACPPPAGENSQQITGVTKQNNQTPRTAGFTDNNSNNAANGPMSVTYAWNFTCDAGATVNQYDPVITNGGKT
jgi:hypothetical protein